MKRHLALPHGYAGAVPEALLGLHLLVVIVPAGAQRRSQLILVLCQALPTQATVRLQQISHTHSVAEGHLLDVLRSAWPMPLGAAISQGGH